MTDGRPPMQDKLRPHAIDAEEAVLGGILTDPDAILTTIEMGLKPEDFFVLTNGQIYQAMLFCLEKYRAIDLVLLDGAIKDLGIQRPGIFTYLTDLINSTPTSIHVRHYTERVLEPATKRHVISTAEDIARIAYDPSVRAADVLNQARVRMMEVPDRGGYNGGGLVGASSIVLQFDNRMQAIAENPELGAGLLTTLKALDAKITGLFKGEVVIIAGRPGMGKSALGLWIALKQVLAGKRVAIYSYEMPRENIMARWLASLINIDSKKVRAADFGDSWDAYTVWGNKLASLNFMVNASSLDSNIKWVPPTFAEMMVEVEKYTMTGPLDLLVVDYLQLVPTGMKFPTREQEVAYITRQIKLFAGRIACPILLLSQLNREYDRRGNKKPQITDLRESGAIEQDADKIILLHRELDEAGQPMNSIIDLIVGKGREDGTGTVSAMYVQNTNSFFDLELRQALPAPQKEVFNY